MKTDSKILQKRIDKPEKVSPDRKQLEEKAAHEQKIEAIGRMAGGIAHDFNNILAGIVGYTTLLKEGC